MESAIQTTPAGDQPEPTHVGGENNSSEVVNTEDPTTKIPAESFESTKPGIIQDNEPEKPKSRYTKSAGFSPDEFAYLDSICEARIQSGLTRDWNHFIRQCVDFAVNYPAKPGQVSFAKPNIPQLYLTDSFFQPNKK